MHDSALDKITLALAHGQGEWAENYLRHFPRAERAAPVVRARLAERVRPEVMEVFERLAPWLLDAAPDDTAVRVREALEAAGAEGLTASGIADKVRRVPVEEIAAVVNAMKEAGEVRVEKVKTKGRTRFVHRLAQHSAGFHTMDEATNAFSFTVPESARVYPGLEDDAE